MTKTLGLVIAFWVQTVFANPANQFHEFFSQLEAISANFTQTIYNENNLALDTSSGTIVFKRPKQLFWHTKTPNEQILLLNNNELWFVDVELEQANLQQINDLKQTPLYYLINKPESIDNTPKFSYSKAGVNWYSSQDKQIQFGFKDQQLHAISTNNEFGQTIRVVFSQVNLAPSISPNTFVLSLDDNFDIVKSF